jgi:Ca2+-transporting ATPase
MGTTVAYGRGRGLVVATGMRTELGLIADMLQSVEQEETPLQQRLEELGKLLGWGALAICAIVFGVGIVRSGIFTPPFTFPLAPEATGALVESFMIAVSLAIAAVPEGLPAVVTISLALGMREMVRRHALIRKLASVETLGSATVICSDKTGTLTQNVMTATRLWVDGRFVDLPAGEEGLRLQGEPVPLNVIPGAATALWVGVLNNDAHLEPIGAPSGEGMSGDGTAGAGAAGLAGNYRVVGDPTEACILLAAARAGVLQDALNLAYLRRQEIPFDSTRKRMVTVHAIEAPDPRDSSPLRDASRRSESVVAVKGAPDVVLRLCTHIQTFDDQVRPLDARMRTEILAANDSMTHDALRVLGLAYRLIPAVPSAPPASGAAPGSALDTAPGSVPGGELEQELIFAGLIGMIDPPRREVKPALANARAAGIRTIMITGDYPNTARAVAESIGLLRPGHAVLTGLSSTPWTTPPLRPRCRRPTSSPASRRSTSCGSSMPCVPATRSWR